MRGNLHANASSCITHLPMPKLLDCFLRISANPLSVAAIWLTVTNQQEYSDSGKLKSSNLIGLKYMVCISTICAGYAFYAAVSSWLRFLVAEAWVFFLSDQRIVAYLMLTSGAAVLEILHLAFNDDQQITWSEACTSYGKFYNKMKITLILHALALGSFIILALISASMFFSMFDPPVSSNQEVEEERA